MCSEGGHGYRQPSGLTGLIHARHSRWRLLCDHTKPPERMGVRRRGERRSHVTNRIQCGTTPEIMVCLC